MYKPYQLFDRAASLDFRGCAVVPYKQRTSYRTSVGSKAGGQEPIKVLLLLARSQPSRRLLWSSSHSPLHDQPPPLFCCRRARHATPQSKSNEGLSMMLLNNFFFLALLVLFVVLLLRSSSVLRVSARHSCVGCSPVATERSGRRCHVFAPLLKYTFLHTPLIPLSSSIFPSLFTLATSRAWSPPPSSPRACSFCTAAS